ncbi:MAG: hypothetical protein FD149_1992 [Rhodospirillaceae bacterium]|nr:MAG: hypothetical protein FD149_1992 [Rhodospirillaceae bacterium]
MTRQAHGSIHIGRFHRVAATQAGVQRIKRRSRHLHQTRRSGNGDRIATGIDLHSQSAFNSVQIDILRSEQDLKQRVVVELARQGHAGGCGHTLFPFCAVASTTTTAGAILRAG